MMRLIKHNAALLLITVCLLALNGCTLIQGKVFVETKDTNGKEDTSLAILTDRDVCAEDPRCYCVNYGFAPKGEKSYTNEDYWHDADITEAGAATPLSGVALLQQTYGKTETILFTVEPKLTEGNLRIVLLDQNYTVLYDFVTDKPSSIEITDAANKEYEIRAIGESAKFEITTTRQFR